MDTAQIETYQERPLITAWTDAVLKEMDEWDKDMWDDEETCHVVNPEIRMLIQLLRIEIGNEWDQRINYERMWRDGLSERNSLHGELNNLRGQVGLFSHALANASASALLPAPEMKQIPQTIMAEMMPGMQVCRRCKRNQLLDDYATDRSASNGHASVCKICYQEDRLDKKALESGDDLTVPVRTMNARVTQATNETIRHIKSGGELTDEFKSEIAKKHQLGPHMIRVVIEDAMDAKEEKNANL